MTEQNVTGAMDESADVPLPTEAEEPLAPSGAESVAALEEPAPEPPAVPEPVAAPEPPAAPEPAVAPAVPPAAPPAPAAAPVPPPPPPAAPQPASYAPPQAPPGAYAPKSRTVAGILGILLGGLGVHKFYLGYTNEGLIMLAGNLLWVVGMGWVPNVVGFVEGIIYLTKSDAEFEALYVADKRPWF